MATEKLMGAGNVLIPDIVNVSSTLMLTGSLVSIATAASPTVPIAVGTLRIDAKDIREGDRGQAVHVLHTHDDLLWESGHKGSPPAELAPLELVLQNALGRLKPSEANELDAITQELEASSVSGQPAQGTLTTEGKLTQQIS